MARLWRTGSAVVALTLAAYGCASQPHWGTADDAPPVQLPQPRTGGDADAAPPVTRSQKPDADAKPPEAPPLPTTPTAELLTGQPAARVGATVNKAAILNEEVLAAAYQGLLAARDLPEPERTQRRAEIWNLALSQLVEREVVLQDAFAKLEKAGGKANLKKLTEEASEQFEKTVLRTWMKASGSKTEDDLRDFFKSQGMSLEMQRRQWERNFMAMEYLRSRVHPFMERAGTGQEIREYYEKHPDEFQRPDSVQWQDLFVEAERYPNRDEARRFADQLAERARGGEDFAKLAEQYDNGDSSFRKGEGIGTKRGEIKPPEAEATLFQMKDGDTAVVELEKGFHVVRVVKRVVAGLVDFDEKTQKQIKEKLGNEAAQVEMKQIVNDLKHKAVIVYSKADN